MSKRLHSRGFGLIEVLISLLILSVGLLGIAALQARAQQAEMESYQRSQALLLLSDMLNRIDTNRAAAGCYVTETFVGSGTEPDPCTEFGTTATRQRADDDLTAWMLALDGDAEQLDDTAVGAMIGARGCIRANETFDVFTVSVAWQGLSATFANTENDCAVGEYGAETQRRVVSATIRIANLN
jgi:type IV pilus assembly protein PilV